MTHAIRPARPSDAPAVGAVSERAWRAAHQPIVGEAAVTDFLDEYYDEESIRGRIAAERDAHPVATLPDGDLVGFAHATATEDDPERWALTQCYVAPDYWNEGIGSDLLEAVEDHVSDHDGTRLRLGVMVPNERAIAFYEAHGFERIESFHDDRLGVDSYRYARAVD